MEQQLPDELWIQIFEFVLDEDILLQPTLPTSMSEYAWYIHTNPDTLEEEWALRSPQEALAVIQRESWNTKMALSKTCRRFNALVNPYLYRCLSFDDPTRIPRFNLSIDIYRSEEEKIKANAKLGGYTKRLYVSHTKLQDDTLAEALSTLISHTTSLQSLVIDSHSPISLFPFPSAFTLLAQALTSTPIRKTLHTLHLHAVPYESLSHLILTFDSLRNLVVAHVHVSPPRGEEDIKLGASGGLHIVLRKLRQLSLSGRFGTLMDQMICGGWDFVELRALSVDMGSGRVEMPDLVGFLCGGSSVTAGGESMGDISAGDGWEGVGKNLWFLDIQASALHPELNVPKILDTCTQLRTFGFSADWRFPNHNNHPPGHNQQLEQSVSQITLPGSPHHHIHTIILHGLNYAFNSGLTAQGGGGGFMAHYVRRSNDMNFAALTKEQFPALKRVRVGSGKVLQELDKNGGPTSGSAVVAAAAADTSGNNVGNEGWATVFSQATAVLSHPSSTNPYGAGGGMDRWERWYDQCVALGVRLEDCTGGVLGELPPPLGVDGKSDSEGEEEDMGSDWDSEEGSYEAEQEEEEVAETLLSPSDSDSESSTPDSKGKGKGKESSPFPKRRNGPRLSIEETGPYIRRVREMTKAIPPPPTPPDSPKKPSNNKFKFKSGAGLSKPHVQELRRLVEECRLFESQGEKENRKFTRTREMATLMGADDEDDFSESSET